MKPIQAEYIWLGGYSPQELRSKTKIVELKRSTLDPKDFPEWGFDGSSTNQAEGHKSDCKLKPVFVAPDPLRGEPNTIVFCEVLNPDGTSHPTNKRVLLKKAQEKYQKSESWAGIEQEYTLYRGSEPLGFAAQKPSKPRPQGPYYCGVGTELIFGRPLIEAHTRACLDSGLKIAGTNAEVMPGQWEFQIGPLDPLRCADELWLARWILKRLGEEYGLTVSFAPKPVVKGDWNGAGGHTNFSTDEMREKGGIKAVLGACRKLEKFNKNHIAVYGKGNEERLTGKHETCGINHFRWGLSDRGASIRIPMATINAGCGYLEDRRPAANMDPYEVLIALLETICGSGFQSI